MHNGGDVFRKQLSGSPLITNVSPHRPKLICTLLTQECFMPTFEVNGFHGYPLKVNGFRGYPLKVNGFHGYSLKVNGFHGYPLHLNVFHATLFQPHWS